MLPVDFLVTTIIRPKCIRRLLDSINKWQPGAKITVADQNEEKHDFYNEYDVNQVLDLDYDVGLAKARNRMVEETEEPYVLIMDDDFIFDKRTKIETFLKIIKSDPKIGVVGGITERNGDTWDFTHRWKVDDDTIYQVDDEDNWEQINGTKCKETGSVINFALMRREIFEDVKWDERFKIGGEHSDFYLQLKKTDWKVYFTPEVRCQTQRDNDKEYSRMRKRKEFFKKFLEKYDVKRMINTYGLVKEWDFKRNQLKTYRDQEYEA